MIRHEVKAYLRLMATVTLLCFSVSMGTLLIAHIFDYVFEWKSFEPIWYLYCGGTIISVCSLLTFFVIPLIEAIRNVLK